ncbi:sigma-70 family RNA polymerase sigma factor [soil metagenome]
MQPTEDELLARLRAGDETAFSMVVERHHTAMLRLARTFVPDEQAAEDVVQETWAAVVQGLASFEGRSSFRTWLYRILVNRAKTRGVKDARTVPFSVLAQRESGVVEEAVDPARFSQEPPGWLDHWTEEPRRWALSAEDYILMAEVQERVRISIMGLPPAQRVVIALRDVEGWPASDVAELLDISDGNMRVLLHRARARVRRALEEYFDGR